ncbi:MAG: hypothetical protein PHG25_03640 [Candidatus Pacebacteria bacterium]|nr:hypothetical protein [Candidatus Paceibacterota bacterium]
MKKKLTHIKLVRQARMPVSIEMMLSAMPHTLPQVENGGVGLFDYLAGKGMVLGNKVPLEVMAKIAWLILYHANMAYGQSSRYFKFATLDEALLNNSTNENITPREDVKLPRGLKLRSKLFFALDLEIVTENDVSIGVTKTNGVVGDKLLFTDAGPYRWVYEYKRAPRHLGWHRNPRYKKNLLFCRRLLPTVCTFEPMDEAVFQALFEKRPELFLNLMHRIHRQLVSHHCEVSRPVNLVQSEAEEIFRILNKLSYR